MNWCVETVETIRKGIEEDRVHELQILVNKLRNLSINIPESFQVSAIIAKLPPS